MKGAKWMAAVALLLAARGVGMLPRGREIEERKLISALAVDGKDTITVTAVTGVRVSEDEAAEVLNGEGSSLAQACRELRKGSARRAYLGQTEQILIGEEGELGKTLDFILTDRELRMDTLLYIVRGDAGKALEDSAEMVAGETGGQDPRGRTVGELLPRLIEGEYTFAPALAPGENGALEPAGWAVLSSEGVVGCFEADAALGATLLAGVGEGQVVSFPHGAAELTAAKIWAVDGTLRCALTARVAEGEVQREELEDWGKRVLRAALAPGWDCWGLDRQLGALRPGDWETWRKYPVEKLTVKVTGKLVNP